MGGQIDFLKFVCSMIKEKEITVNVILDAKKFLTRCCQKSLDLTPNPDTSPQSLEIMHEIGIGFVRTFDVFDS